MLNLLTSDGKSTFRVPDGLVDACLTLKMFKEEFTAMDGQDDCNETVPVPNLGAVELSSIIEFYNEMATVAMDEKMEVGVRFLQKFQIGDMYKIINAAHYLGYTMMVDMCCETLAKGLKDRKSPTAIRAYLGIISDFTPEEEEAILRENKWAFSDAVETE